MKILLRKDNILLLIYTALTLIYALPISNISLFNYALTILFYFNVVFILLGLLYAFLNRDYKNLIFMVICGVVAFIVCLINGTSIHNLCVLLTLIIGMYYTTSIGYSRDFYKILCLFGVFYNIVSFIYCSNYFERWANNSDTLMNPNTIGIMNLFYAIIVNSYIHLFYKNRNHQNFIARNIKKIIYVLYNAVVLFLLFSYRGRTSQSAFLAFLVLFLVFKEQIESKPKLIVKITGTLILLGILFPIFYINMPKNIMIWISTVTGKPYFSGREVIWSRFFTALSNKTNLIIGPGSGRKAEYTSLWESHIVYSMHNNFLDIMLCFGCIGIIIFMAFTLWRIYFLSKAGKITNYVCLLGYMSFIVLGYSENTFVYAFFVMIYNLLLGMSLYNNGRKSFYHAQGELSQSKNHPKFLVQGSTQYFCEETKKP